MIFNEELMKFFPMGCTWNYTYFNPDTTSNDFIKTMGTMSHCINYKNFLFSKRSDYSWLQIN